MSCGGIQIDFATLMAMIGCGPLPKYSSNARAPRPSSVSLEHVRGGAMLHGA
jgi:hypothetical protein